MKNILYLILILVSPMYGDVIWDNVIRSQKTGYNFPVIQKMNKNDVYVRLEKGGFSGGVIEVYFNDSANRIVVSSSKHKNSIQVTKRAIIFLEEDKNKDLDEFLDAVKNFKKNKFKKEVSFVSGDDTSLFFIVMHINEDFKYVGRVFGNEKQLPNDLKKYINSVLLLEKKIIPAEE